LPTGSGSVAYFDGDFYEGLFKNGLPNGEGVMKYADGDYYEGMFKDGQPNGAGKLVSQNGNIFVGNFSNGEPISDILTSPGTGKEYTLEATTNIKRSSKNGASN